MSYRLLAGKLPTKAERINITLPDRVLRRVDHLGQAAGEARSGLLAHAAVQHIKSRTQRVKFRN